MPGWSWAWHAELEPFPAAVLAARHPGSLNLGDVLAADFDDRAKALGPVDVLVGGPPCQAFSIAGNRNSLSDPRGNLSLRWAQIIHAIGPVFAVTENVPGWLNTPDDAFGHFLGALVGADGPLPAPGGSGWPRAGMVAGPLARACWRVLDAQYFDLAQRRERVFIVSSARDWADPSQILFESAGVRRDTPSRGEARERPARPLSAGSPRGSGYRNDADTAENLIAWGIGPDAVDRSGEGAAGNAAERSGLNIVEQMQPALRAPPNNSVAVAYGGNDTRGPIEVSTALNAHGGPHGRLDFESETFVAQEPVAYQCQGSNVGEAGTLRGGNGHLTGGVPFVATAYRTSGNCGAWDTGDRTDALTTSTDPNSHIVAFSSKDSGQDAASDLAPTLRAMPHDGSHANGGGQLAVAFAENSRAEVRLEGGDGQTVASLKTGGGKPGQSYPAVFLHANKGRPDGRKSAHEPMVSVKDVVPTLATDGHAGSAVWQGGSQQDQFVRPDGVVPTLAHSSNSHGGHYQPKVMSAAIRRLLPVECERLMGLPDFYTDITFRGRPAADGSRYRSLGNSMAVPVLTWLLTRIEAQLSASAEGAAA